MILDGDLETRRAALEKRLRAAFAPVLRVDPERQPLRVAVTVVRCRAPAFGREWPGIRAMAKATQGRTTYLETSARGTTIAEALDALDRAIQLHFNAKRDAASAHALVAAVESDRWEAARKAWTIVGRTAWIQGEKTR